MVISVVDISDRRRAEIAELQIKHDRSIMEGISDTCHAIGQPATVLLSSLEILKDSPNIDFKARKEVEDMCYSAVLELRECLWEMNAARRKIQTSHSAAGHATPAESHHLVKTTSLSLENPTPN